MHNYEINKTLEILETSDNGLSTDEAKTRLIKYGNNTLGTLHKRNALDILVSQFDNFILWLLLLAVVISFFIGHMIDAIAISVAIILSISFGFFLEFKADKSLDLLRSLTKSTILVKRDNKHVLLDSSELVPGDIVYLSEGLKIPADARLIKCKELETNESHLTGESATIKKTTEQLPEDTLLAERKNMVYAGSFVTKGEAKAVVVATGAKTEIGIISSAISDIKEESTVLQKSLDDLGKKISIVSILVILVLFLIGLWQKKDLFELFILSVSLAVASVPEGLITILTVVLAIGVRRMAEHNALVRNIKSVETLGTSTILIVDKTGTVTLGKMGLVNICMNNLCYKLSDISKDNKAILYSILCNHAKVTDQGFFGDEMDKAIYEAANSIGLDIKKIRKENEPVDFYPLDTEKRRMKALFKFDDKEIMIIKGAPERIISICNKIEVNGKVTKVNKKDLLSQLEDFTTKGMRVLALAYREKSEKELTFLAFLGFQDPPRKNVAETLREAKLLGMRVLMLTGDNLETASSVGRQIGLIERPSQAIEWNKLKDLDYDQLSKKLSEVNIIARSTPLSKLTIVENFIEQGEIVAVTGDGINDAPALKKAHVGVVMGSGTDVSKESGNLVLLDDNISTLVSAIHYGRTVFSNVINFIRFQFTTNAATLMMFIIIFFLDSFLAIPYFLTPIQILFLNLIMDGPPALALGFEASTNKQEVNRKILSKKLAISIFLSALFMVLVTFFVFFNFTPSKALTGTFVVFILLQLFNSLNCRSSSKSFFYKPKNNAYVFATFLAMLFVLYLVVELPFFQKYLLTTSLTFYEWVYLFLIGSTILIFEEIKKLVMIKLSKTSN